MVSIALRSSLLMDSKEENPVRSVKSLFTTDSLYFWRCLKRT